MKSSKKIIGELIKHQRTKKGLTLEELATKLETDRHYIWKLENGKTNMTLDYIDKVIKALKCSHKEFFSPSLSACPERVEGGWPKAGGGKD